MIKVGLVSDLHTEFWTPRDHQLIGTKIQEHLATADIILLPGDIGVGMDSIEMAKSLFPDKPVFMVLGNHEFYHDDLQTVIDTLQAAATDIHLLHKSVAYIEVAGTAVRIIGTTLWTDFDLHASVDLSLLDARRINDFHLIVHQDRILLPSDTMVWHWDQRTWLLQMLDESFNGITIVMTHHAPASFAISSKYVNDPLSPCYASRMETLLLRDDLPLVVWGHTHHCVDRTIDKTRFVSSQTGYPGRVTGSMQPTETGCFGTIIEIQAEKQ